MECTADIGEERPWITAEHAIGGAVDVVAGGDQVDVDLMIVLESKTIAVVAIAVGFDDHPLTRPEEVDEVLGDKNVHLGQRQIRLAAQSQEVDLHSRERIDGSRIHFRRNATEAAGALATAPMHEHTTKFSPSQATASIRGDQHSLDLPGIEARCHVKEGSLDRRDWDAGLLGPVARLEGAGLVQANARVPSSA